MPNRFTEAWYQAASEDDLLQLAHAYDEGQSDWLMQNSDEAKSRLRLDNVYGVKNRTVVLTSKLVLSLLTRYGWSAL